MIDFAALRFTEDGNIADRVYWYRCDFPVKEGEAVLAPVGPNDRIQKARVERTLSAEEAAAPYDLRLIKRVEAKLGARKLTVGDVALLEFGGVRYDDRHYTRFSRLLYGVGLPAVSLSDFGITTVLRAPMSEDEAVYRAIVHRHGTLLLGGEGEQIFAVLLALLKGETRAEEFLFGLGLGEREVLGLKKVLG